jgi:hypothetical protein
MRGRRSLALPLLRSEKEADEWISPRDCG